MFGLFGRKADASAQDAPSSPSTTDGSDPTSGKGRPTPSRKDAEAARKQCAQMVALCRAQQEQVKALRQASGSGSGSASGSASAAPAAEAQAEAAGVEADSASSAAPAPALEAAAAGGSGVD